MQRGRACRRAVARAWRSCPQLGEALDGALVVAATGARTTSAGTRALTVSIPRLGGVSMTIMLVAVAHRFERSGQEGFAPDLADEGELDAA